MQSLKPENLNNIKNLKTVEKARMLAEAIELLKEIEETKKRLTEELIRYPKIKLGDGRVLKRITRKNRSITDQEILQKIYAELPELLKLSFNFQVYDILKDAVPKKIKTLVNKHSSETVSIYFKVINEKEG